MINLKEKQPALKALAERYFNRIMRESQETRGDEKHDQRTGIQVLLKFLQTRDMINFPVYSPSPEAQHFASHKSGITEVNNVITSQDVENVKIFWFRGCISFRFPDGIVIHCSLSGLLGSEDVAGAIILMAEAKGTNVDIIINNIIDRRRFWHFGRKGKLPNEIFNPNHYLGKILNEYRNGQL